MKAVRLAEAVQPPSVIEANLPQPQPSRDELLIRVHAAGVMRTELSWYPTSHCKNGEARIGAVPSHEFSGVVEGVGVNVGCLAIGQEVFGMNDWYSDGAMAEYCIAPFFAVAPRPARLSHAEAASVPISALTAWQGLFSHARLQAGERVLIHGGAGAVGTFAIQLARLHGAHVIATASAKNADFVSSLGAESVIDHDSSRFDEHLRDVDVVFDTVGGETLERSWNVLGPRGRLVTVVSSVEESSDTRTKAAFFIVEPNQKQLYKIGELLETGRIRPIVDAVVPFGLAADAYRGEVARQGRGKLIVAIDDTPKH